MGDDAIMAKPRRQRRLKSGCGCVLLLFLLLLAGGGILFHLLGRWKPDETAWDKLPAGTVWACQAHDLRTLLQAAARDPGASNLLLRGRAALNDRLTDSHWEGERGNDILDAYRRFGWLHTLAAPNSLVVGGLGPGPEKSFLIFQSPTWLRWLGSLSDWDKDTVFTHDDDEQGITLFSTPHEGWLIVATSPDCIRTVLDGWDAKATPLGAGPEGTGAHFFAAVHDSFAKGDGIANAAPQPTHFTFADPFAPPGGKNDTRSIDRDSGLATRVLIRPATEGWDIRGEVDGMGVFDPATMASLESSPSLTDALAGTRSHDLTISARLSAESRRKLVALFQPGNASVSPQESAARNWLHDSWLVNSGDAWKFLATAPAGSSDLPYPPLPWFSLGWTLAAGGDPRMASEQFAGGATRLVDSIAAPGAPDLVQAMLATVSYSLNGSPESPGGVVNFPPVPVNAARPAWRFDIGRTPPQAWIASDPHALPVEADVSSPVLPPPEADHVVLVGEWIFSEEFIDSVVAVAEDRLTNFAALRPLDDAAVERLESALRVFAHGARAFPRGAVNANLDTARRRLLFKAAIPRGVDAGID